MKSAVDIFAEGARDGVYPGGQLTISVGGKRVVSAAVGVLGKGQAKVSHDTAYDLASLTKPLATTLLLGRAIEAKLATLDDHLAKYVPGAHPVWTLRQALEHSTGLPAHGSFHRELPQEIVPGSWDAWRRIVEEVARVQPLFEPGSRALYGDLGFILLGAALEVMLSLPLSTAFALLGTRMFFRDRRGPPSLPPTATPSPIAPTEGCPLGVVHDENARAMGGAAGHAGLFGSAEGVMRVAELLVHAYHGWEGGLVRPEWVRTMWSQSVAPGSNRALGWDRPARRGSSTGGRWPLTSVGHLGFTGTSIWIEPERALIVVLLTNRVHPTRANNLIRRLRPALHDACWEEWGSGPRARGQRAQEDPTERIQIPGGGRESKS